MLYQQTFTCWLWAGSPDQGAGVWGGLASWFASGCLFAVSSLGKETLSLLSLLIRALILLGGPHFLDLVNFPKPASKWDRIGDPNIRI